MDSTLKISRSNFEALGRQYEKAVNIIIEKEVIADINCYWFYKNGTKPKNRVIIYLHGGCFVLGSIHSHQALVSHFAKELDIPFLFIDYSLAPENPYPSAIHEIVKVYHHILYKTLLHDITMMGDSAGAGLALSVISHLNTEKINKPHYLVMLSPWVDVRCSNNSVTQNATIDPILTKEELQTFASIYLGNKTLSDANPIETMVGNYPPTLILVGSREILLDDSKMVRAKIAETQPNTTLRVYDNQTHVWLLDNIHTESSKNAIVEIDNFINK